MLAALGGGERERLVFVGCLFGFSGDGFQGVAGGAVDKRFVVQLEGIPDGALGKRIEVFGAGHGFVAVANGGGEDTGFIGTVVVRLDVYVHFALMQRRN